MVMQPVQGHSVSYGARTQPDILAQSPGLLPLTSLHLDPSAPSTVHRTPGLLGRERRDGDFRELPVQL